MRLIEQFFKILAPYDCLGCGTEGSLLCSWCMEAALPATDGRCYRCNRLSANYKVCTTCRRHSSLNHLWVRTQYSDIAKELIHRMKFKYSGEAADMIAAEMLNTLPALGPDVLIINVPSISRHIRQRGFDHTLRISRLLSQKTGWLRLPALVRHGHSTQVGASRKQRLTQTSGVFSVRIPGTIKGANILLVDDVLTTGATMEAAAKALKQAGAKTVDAVVFARAI